MALEKKGLQSTPTLALFNQILNQVPKIVNLNEKSDFETLYNSKVKKNIKYIVFSGEWMKYENILLMENSTTTYSLLEEQAVEKQLLYKIWGKMNCLGASALFFGYRKSLFLKSEKKISGTALAIKRYFLIIQKT